MCTDCVSPVDCNVGRALKLKIAKRYNASYAAHKAAWEAPKRRGGLSDARKRMYVAEWASDAWREMCGAGGRHFIESSFVKTGFLLAKDGSANGNVE